MRPVLVNQNSIVVIVVERITADVISPIANQNAFVELAGQPLSNDTARESRPYYEKDYTYDDYRPAYQYGLDSRTQHAGRSWDQVETDLARDWDRVKSHSRLNWDKAEGKMNG